MNATPFPFVRFLFALAQSTVSNQYQHNIQNVVQLQTQKNHGKYLRNKQLFSNEFYNIFHKYFATFTKTLFRTFLSHPLRNGKKVFSENQHTHTSFRGSCIVVSGFAISPSHLYKLCAMHFQLKMWKRYKANEQYYVKCWICLPTYRL